MRSAAQVLVHDTVIVATPSFAEAQATVRRLRSSGMTADSLAVVGADLVLAERPAESSVARLTARTAASGLGIGLLAAIFVTLVADTNLTGLVVVLWGAVYGVIIGALTGFFRGLIRNRPDAVSTEVVPARYEVRCAAADASVARSLLDPPPARAA
ncbi:general stress protein [Kribbella sp. CA-293567]|uniref:general stress protein n=1 Tax=Kribbella sp. CA-293567 TaxID=3002436 RepID=UPI0022DD5852|nr:general stress protein [Kribbella sp. CA-293567]WBQ07540.1 hypothetical protein OX958_12215 [Kribbella sp. CA-293567]